LAALTATAEEIIWAAEEMHHIRRIFLVERWNKSADGTTLYIGSGSVDGSGKATGRQRTMALRWSSSA
jgi:hypothetical protein